MTAEHVIHENHTHEHGPGCGHVAIPHGDHVDYVHDGHLHHKHEDHWDECGHLTCS
ncbi:hypothetical protein [Corynebacterium sp. c7Ub_26]